MQVPPIPARQAEAAPSCAVRPAPLAGPIRPRRYFPTVTRIADLRRDYARESLSEQDVLADPIAQFRHWFDQALAADVLEVNAMALATVNADGQPSVRMVLLKELDQRGFVFFTDYRSRKGQELDAAPRAGLCFHWGELERQVRVTGAVERITRAESAEYFRSRPVGSQLGAWTSQQSTVIPSREALERTLIEVGQRFGDEEVPLPDHWGGYRVVPQEIEFWQGRPSRLHDRLHFRRGSDGAWQMVRLSP
jgi:pyridoxamine 5'-phosphate oxidase